MGKIVEGMWSCPHCKTVNILGRYRECPNCGKPRDNNTTFYLDKKNLNYVSDEEAKKLQDPDWTCKYCKSLNKASDKVCSSCGAERTAENTDYFQNQEIKRKEEARIKADTDVFTHPISSSEMPYTEPSIPLNETVNTNTHTNNKFNTAIHKPITKKIIAGVIALITLFAVVFALIPKEKTLTITGMSWDKVIQIEEYKTVQESDWSVPSGGRETSSRQEVYDYEQILDHYETKTREVSETVQDGYSTEISYVDNGNGYFEEKVTQVPQYKTVYHTETYEEPVYRQEPIYKTKYYYDIERWVENRQVTGNGVFGENFDENFELNEKEREKDRIEKYYLTTTNKKNKENTYTIDYSYWKTLSIGQVVKAKVNFDNITKIEILK